MISDLDIWRPAQVMIRENGIMDGKLNRLLKTIRTIVVILVALLFSISSTVAGEKRVDIGSLMRDMMRFRIEPPVMLGVVWLPNEYWEAVYAIQRAPKAPVTRLSDMLRPYIIFFVAKADVGPVGAPPTFMSEPDLRMGTRLIDAVGNRYAPIPASELASDLSTMLETMRPVLERTAGPTGKGMRVMVFSATNEAGERIADATREGRFSLAIADQLVHWRTPLGALVPDKKDPTTGELLSGAWTYSPWTGAKLLPAEEQ